jgi:hypothetical protein
VARKYRDLYSNIRLGRYITDQARRHFGDPQDQADARQSAWEALSKSKMNRPCSEYERIAYNAIHALYEHERRIRKREILTRPDPRCT